MLWRIDYVEADRSTVGHVMVEADTFQDAYDSVRRSHPNVFVVRNCMGWKIFKKAVDMPPESV